MFVDLDKYIKDQIKKDLEKEKEKAKDDKGDDKKDDSGDKKLTEREKVENSLHRLMRFESVC